MSHKPDEFTAMLQALQGVTVLEQPRVSREVLISTLREQTLIIREMKKNLTSVSALVTTLAGEAADNRRILQNLTDDVKKQKTDIESLYRLSDEFRTEMNELGEKVTELYVLKDQMREQRAIIADLSNRYEAHVVQMTEYTKVTDRSLGALDKKIDDTNFHLKELKDYVEHFGDNLILPSSQITVETTSGFDTRPKPLLEVLKMCSATFNSHQETMTEQSNQIAANKALIDTKADESVLHEVKGMQRKLGAIENHLMKDEEQGVGAIRRACEELTDKMQSMTSEMQDKMDRKEVGFIVHEKYEEIVKYLQDALQASTEDENNFKQKADEIQTLVLSLSNTKADRVEIAPMQEIIVKTEAMMKNLSKQSKTGKDSLSKKEIEALLELKVDKAVFEQQMQGVSKGKRGKRLTALGGVQGIVIDEAETASKERGAVAVPESSMRGGLSTSIQEDPSGDKAMWRGLADAMKEESEEAVMRSAQKALRNRAAATSSSTDFGAYMLAKKAQTFGAASTSMSLPSNGNPGQFRQPSEAGRAGGPNSNADSRPSSNHGYAAPYGAPGGPGYNASAAVDYGQSDYPHVPPDLNQSPDGLPSPHVQDMSFLGGQMAGGGFNMRAGTSLRQGVLKPVLGAGGVEDVEGRGLMLKGKDGQLYYTDDFDFDPSTPGLQSPTAKKKVLQPRE